MRVYHFLNEEFGLADLRQRRLKIANLNELNDPFEFLSVNLSDLSLRGAFHAMKAEIAKKPAYFVSAVIGTTQCNGVTTLPNIQEYV